MGSMEHGIFTYMDTIQISTKSTIHVSKYTTYMDFMGTRNGMVKWS